jgi:sortase A
VDQIRVVLPTDLSEIQIVEGKDYCTLVTCTPYGINTHRLLVRGHRVDNPQGDVAVVADAMIIDSVYVAPFIAAPIILILVLIVLLGNRKPKKGAKR